MILDVIFEPWFLALVISLGALLVLAIIFIIIVSKKRKGKPKHIKVDDEFTKNFNTQIEKIARQVALDIGYNSPAV